MRKTPVGSCAHLRSLPDRFAPPAALVNFHACNASTDFSRQAFLSGRSRKTGFNGHDGSIPRDMSFAHVVPVMPAPPRRSFFSLAVPRESEAHETLRCPQRPALRVRPGVANCGRPRRPVGHRNAALPPRSQLLAPRYCLPAPRCSATGTNCQIGKNSGNERRASVPLSFLPDGSRHRSRHGHQQPGSRR